MAVFRQVDRLSSNFRFVRDPTAAASRGPATSMDAAKKPLKQQRYYYCFSRTYSAHVIGFPDG
jgi:hypothetical protein